MRFATHNHLYRILEAYQAGDRSEHWFVATVWLLGLGLAACTEALESTRFDFVVLADTAYSVPEDYPAYYRLIERINRAAPAFTIHLGDTKSGGTDCGDDAQRKIKADFHQFDHPLIYTPGDKRIEPIEDSELRKPRLGCAETGAF